MLAIGGFLDVLDQPHLRGAVGADGFEHGQGFRIGINVVLEFGALGPDVFAIDEDGWYAGIDHGGVQGAHARHLQVVHQVAGGEHGAFAIGRVHEFHLDFRRGEGDAIQFEIAGFLYFTVGDGHAGDDGFLDVGLPDAHGADAVFRNSVFGNEATVDGEGTYGSGQVAAVTAPVDKWPVNRDLAEQVVDIVVRPGGLGQDDGFAGAGGSAAHAVDLFLVGVGAADHAQQELVPGFAWSLAGFWEVLKAEEHAF